MIIVYASKTGFTKKYAELLAAKTQLRAFSLKDLSKISRDEDILFLGWMKAGKIQGLAKIRKYSVKAVCGSGTGRTAEPGTEAVIARRLFSVKRSKGNGPNHDVLVLKYPKETTGQR